MASNQQPPSTNSEVGLSVVGLAPGLLDRRGEWRQDEARLREALEVALVVPVWRGKMLVVRDDANLALAGIPQQQFAAIGLETETPLIFLGTTAVKGAARPLFAVGVHGRYSEGALPAGDGLAWMDGRLALAQIPAESTGLLMTTRGLVYWHREHQYCGKCGSATQPRRAGYCRFCAKCDREHYPRLDPAVMIAVTHGDRLLVARQANFPKGMFSVLAGFVDFGETLEGCVAREVDEEVGLVVTEVRYQASQCWAFPRSLMLGFSAVAADSATTFKDGEIIEAKWLTKEELRQPQGFYTPPRGSLSHEMIQRFCAGHFEP